MGRIGDASSPYNVYPKSPWIALPFVDMLIIDLYDEWLRIVAEFAAKEVEPTNTGSIGLDTQANLDEGTLRKG